MTMLAMIGWQELVVIAVVAVLIFGRRLPDVGRSLGEGLLEFKKGLRGVKDDVQETAEQADDALRTDQAGAGTGDEKKG